MHTTCGVQESLLQSALQELKGLGLPNFLEMEHVNSLPGVVVFDSALSREYEVAFRQTIKQRRHNNKDMRSFSPRHFEAQLKAFPFERSIAWHLGAGMC